MGTLFEVWRVPVPPEGNSIFKDAKLVYTAKHRDAAADFIYFEDADEPAPDKREFRRYEIREVPDPATWVYHL